MSKLQTTEDYYSYLIFDEKLKAHKQNIINKINAAVHPEHLRIVKAQLNNFEEMWQKEWGKATARKSGDTNE